MPLTDNVNSSIAVPAAIRIRPFGREAKAEADIAKVLTFDEARRIAVGCC